MMMMMCRILWMPEGGFPVSGVVAEGAEGVADAGALGESAGDVVVPGSPEQETSRAATNAPRMCRRARRPLGGRRLTTEPYAESKFVKTRRNLGRSVDGAEWPHL